MGESVLVAVGVPVGVEVGEYVRVGVFVGVLVGVRVDVLVGVFVGVCTTAINNGDPAKAFAMLSLLIDCHCTITFLFDVIL